jgi:hypothetical protein
MSESLPELLTALSRRVPDMLPKAYRWVAEMQEIASFTGGDPAAASIYGAFARLYERISHDLTGDERESAQLRQFFPDAVK